MDPIKLMRNKWFLLGFLISFFGIVWLSFRLVYKKELFIQEIHKGNKFADSSQVMALYNKMMKSSRKLDEIETYYRLASILINIGKKREAIKVLNRLVKTVPEDRSLRLSLAVELHNEKRYREAEKHFVVLLKKNSKDSLRCTPLSRQLFNKNKIEF